MVKKKASTEPSAEEVKRKADLHKVASKWLKAISRRRTSEKTWRDQATAVVKRYRDERDLDNNAAKFAMLWANTEVMKPAIFSRMPVPDVRRRYLTKDPAARTAAMIMERALSFTMDSYDFRDTLDRCVEDYLLPGRSQAVITYKPYFEKKRVAADPLPADDPDAEPKYAEGVQQDDDGAYSMQESKLYEEVRCVYQDWRLYVFGEASQRDQVPWEAYGEYLTRDEIGERFEKLDRKTVARLPYCADYKDEALDDKHAEQQKKCLLWRAWDKTSRTVISVVEGFTDEPVDVEPDPLQLEEFFPAPEPMYSLRTNGSMIPKPEYLMYQDQAQELDLLVARQRALASALKYRGVYDKQLDELAKISDLVKAPDNTFIPVADFARLGEKGGLEACLDTMPLEEIRAVLEWLGDRIDLLKQEIYEIYGISDIVRGATQASETLGAQQLKAQYAGMRISTRQERFQRFIRDILRKMGEVIVEHFSPETLMIMTGIQVIPDQQYLQAKEAQQIDPGMVSETEFASAIAMLKDDKLRGFRIDIETDSTVPIDKDTEQKNRVEFMAAIGQFLSGVIPAVETGAITVKIAREALLFVVRGFKVGTELEETLEELGANMDEAQQLAQMKQQLAQMGEESAQLKDENGKLKSDAQTKAQQAQVDMEIDKAKAANQMEIDRRTAAHDAQLKQMTSEHDERIKGMSSQHDAQIKEHSARADSERKQRDDMAKAQTQSAGEDNKKVDAVLQGQKAMTQTLQQLSKAMIAATESQNAQTSALLEALKSMGKPKNRKIMANLPSGPVEMSMSEN